MTDMNRIILHIQRVESILFSPGGHKEQDLFALYTLARNEEEKEAVVLALIGKLLMLRAQKKVNT